MKRFLLAASIALVPLVAHAQQAGSGAAVQDANNAAFVNWPIYVAGTTYTPQQLAGVRSIELNLTAAGTVTLTDQSGNAMALPYSVTGAYTLPFVPASVTFSAGAAGMLWMLR